VLENVLKRVDLAFQNFFRRVKRRQRSGYPRFRSSRRYDSLTFRKIRNPIQNGKLYLSKIGLVKIRLSRPLPDQVKILTVKREAGRWYALFAVECENNPLPFNRNTTGIDLGLSSFAVLSNGTAIPNPHWQHLAQAKLRRLQRRVSRRKKGSNRRRKAVLTLQRWHNRICNQRLDFQHKVSRTLINNNGLIAVENLNVQGLARGLFRKAVNDAAWSTFIFMLTYKAEEAGRVLVKVDPRGTSQTCTCGAIVKKTLNDRIHFCLSCGLSADRDHVSAQVILSRAKRLQALTSPVTECVV
jgi:putative transposase